LSQLTGYIKPTDPKADPGGNPGHFQDKPEHEVLLIKDNFQNQSYRPELKQRDRYTDTIKVPKITTALMDHQETSLNWQMTKV